MDHQARVFDGDRGDYHSNALEKFADDVDECSTHIEIFGNASALTFAPPYFPLPQYTRNYDVKQQT